MSKKFRWFSGAMVAVLSLSVFSETALGTADVKAVLNENTEQREYFQDERRQQSEISIEKDICKEHQVLVCFEKESARTASRVKKKLKQVREDVHVSGQFGESMRAVKKLQDVISAVDWQEKILSENFGKDYVIEDSIDFDDYVVSLISSKTEDTEMMVKKLSENKSVKYVTPNYLINSEGADFSLNDPYFEYSYSLADETSVNEKNGRGILTRGSIYEGELKNASMHATELWNMAEKEKADTDEVVVAVLDTGIDYYHEELIEHMWTNPGDIGLVGTYGYDFIANDDDPMDENGHGTHCAGIIAAKADNEVGISGVPGKYADDRIKLMALRIFDEEGAESTEFAALGAFRYILTAVENGVNVRIASNSWGADGGEIYGGLFDDVLEKLGKKGVLSLFSAGNAGADLDSRDGSPASSTSEDILCVGSINEKGDKAAYSNYGKSQVDFFAPGSNVLSSVSYDNYLPVIYEKEQLEETTKTYGVFDGNDITPVAAGAETLTFGTPVVLNQDGVEVKEGVKLSVSDERYKNSRTKKSLKVEFSEVKSGDMYYVYFPYQTEKKADGTNVFVAGSVGIPYDLELEHQAFFGVADMLRYSDGTVRRPLVYALSYNGAAADYNLYDFSSSDTFSYTESSAAASHGIAVLYKAEKTAPATLYIDGLAVSRAGVKESVFGKYAFYSGTSMACPNAAGAAALLLLLFPEKTGERTEAGTLAVKNLLLSSVRSSEKLKGFCLTGGFLDLSKAAVGDFSPVISSAEVDVSENTVILSGVNFGKKKGKVSAVHAIREETVPVDEDEILGWDEEKIILRDSKKADGSYKFRGNYLTFSVQTEDGRENESTFYLSAGTGGFERLSKTPVLDTEEEKYAGMVTDGSEIYGVTNVGSVYHVDAKTGKRTSFLSITYALSKLSDEGYFERLGIDYYEQSHDFLISVIGNPVCMNGILYEWLSVRASDRKFYLGLKLDVTAAQPEWNIIATDVSPTKNGYKKIPRVFLFSGAAVCEYKGKIYAAGGYSSGEDSAGSILVYVFNPETEEWKFTGESMPGRAFGLHMEESNGRLYAFLGGSAYSLTADFQQPDHRIFCFDGISWKKLDVVFPFFLKTYLDQDGLVFVNVATAVTGNGILITGASTDGYGDTFLMDTTEADRVSFRALDLGFYGGLNTGEEKYCAETFLQTEDGGYQDAVSVLSEDAEDTAPAYSVYLAKLKENDSAYYHISIDKSGTGTGTVRGLKRIKKYGDYKETLTVVPDENSIISSVKADGQVLKSSGKDRYEFQPEKDTRVVVTFSKKESKVSSSGKKASQAKLEKKKKTIKKGKTCQIRVLRKNGQKVSFSVTKKAKKRGISVSSSGKIKVKKKARTGTYYVTVTVKANSKYKKKKLKFKLIVKS